jgi:serine/threonine protein kinase
MTGQALDPALYGERLDAVLATGPIAPTRLLDIAIQVARILAAEHAEGRVHGRLTPAEILLARNGRIKILNFGNGEATPQDDQLALGEILSAIIGSTEERIDPLCWAAKRLLADQPEDRYSSTRDLYLDLCAVRDRLPAIQAPQAPSREIAQPARKRRPFVAIPLMLLGCSIFVFYLMSHTPPTSRSQAALRSFPVWSSDGRSILFVMPVSGVNQIFMQSYGSATPIQLTHSFQPCVKPRWSPDGKSFAFQRSGKWWTGPVEPGRESALKELSAAPLAMSWLTQ